SYVRGYEMKVELFDLNSKSPFAVAARVVATLVTAAFAAAMVFYSIRISGMSAMRTTQIMHISMKYIYLIPVLGFGFLFLKVVYDAYRKIVPARGNPSS